MSDEANVRRLVRKPLEFNLDNELHALAHSYVRRLGKGKFAPTVIKWLAEAERQHLARMDAQNNTAPQGNVQHRTAQPPDK